MEKDNEKISNNEKDKKDSPYSLTLLYYDQNETKEIKDTKVVTFDSFDSLLNSLKNVYDLK